MIQQVTELRRQHAELRALAANYARELARQAPDLPALAKCRWTLARLVATHLAFQSVHIHPLLGRSGPRGAALARRHAIEMTALGGQLGDHVRKWTPDLIMADWKGFSQASLALVRGLTARIDREAVEIYPLIEVAKAA